MPVVAGLSPLKMQTTKKQINSNSKKEQRLIDLFLKTLNVILKRSVEAYRRGTLTGSPGPARAIVKIRDLG